MKKRLSFILTISLLFTAFFCSCSQSTKLNPNAPVTLTMWHNFGGTMQETMDILIDEFNSTIGKDRGIIINVTAISSSSELQDKMNMILNGDPGAPQMPDIATAYPKTAILFQEKGLLADLDQYFSAKELSTFVPAFLEEGRLSDGGLYVFPFAKSTEILYLNQTLFDRFSLATGVSIDKMSTLEGIAEASMKYYEWTDSLTPDISGDGKAFFAADSWLNLAQAAMKQQGDELFVEESLNLSSPSFKKIWDICYPPCVSGGFAVYDGYSSDLSKTGDLICSTGSSAGILFYGDTITYADNRIEQVEYNILPFPTIENGEKYAIQRGNGLIVSKTDPAKEYAASVFLKWFTAPEQNMRFISSTGYLPVTTEAFGELMEQEIDSVENPRIKQMLTAVTHMYEEYEFFVAPLFDSFDSTGKQYESAYKTLMQTDKESYLSSKSTSDIAKMSEEAFKSFCQ